MIASVYLIMSVLPFPPAPSAEVEAWPDRCFIDAGSPLPAWLCVYLCECCLVEFDTDTEAVSGHEEIDDDDHACRSFSNSSIP